MKKIIFIFSFFLNLSNLSFGQNYYNPSKDININIEFREPYRAVDYNKIGSEINGMINEVSLKREQLKKYYDDIYYETKNTIYSNVVLSSDFLVNEKIILLQNKSIEHLDILNKLLKSGLLNPAKYETDIKKTYYTFTRENNNFLQIVKYDFIKKNRLENESEKINHNEIYEKTLNSVVDFKLDPEFKILTKNLKIPEEISSNLYFFVKNSCEGDFLDYKYNWEEDQRILENERIVFENMISESKKIREKTFEKRRLCMLELNKSEKKKIRKKEKNLILYNLLEEYHTKNQSKLLYKNYFTYENEKFEIVALFNLQGKDPLDTNQYHQIDFYIRILNGFWDTYK